MLDESNPLPLYHQLYALLREQIASTPEVFRERFPSEHELQSQYGVSRATIRHALEHLEADGVIVRRAGRGTFLNPLHRRDDFIARDLSFVKMPDRSWAEQGVHFSATVLEAQLVPCSADVAQSLQVQPGDLVMSLRRLVRSDQEPMWQELRYLPREIADGLTPDDFAEFSVMKVLAERRDVRVTRVDTDVLASVASTTEARRLGIRAGAPVLVTRYTAYAGARPAQTGRTVFRADRYKFRIRQDGADGDWRRPPTIQFDVVPEAASVSASDES